MSHNITLSVSDEVFEKMREFPEMRWSEVARASIEQRLEMLEALESVASKSKLSAKDAEELGEKIKKGIARRHGLG